MRESLSAELMAQELKRLYAAFPHRLGTQSPADTIDVYRRGLGGLSGDAIRNAVDRAIENDAYFPKVARLRDLANEWERRRLALMPRNSSTQANPDACAICGAVPQHRVFEYPKRDKNGQMITNKETGKYEMETIVSKRLEVEHDARAHHVYQEHEADVA